MEAPGTGIDNLPAVCFEHGRTVTCARGLSAVPISEWVLAQILTFEKRLPSSWMTEPPEKWAIRTPPLGELYGKTLGLVGLGGIGEAVAVRALAFGMRVVAVRRTSRPSAVAGVEVLPDLDQLLAAADHLVLAAPGHAGHPSPPRRTGVLRGQAWASTSSTSPVAGSSTRTRCGRRSTTGGWPRPASTP